MNMSLKKIERFKVFSGTLLDRFEGYWNEGRFVLVNADIATKRSGCVMTMDVNEARELIDALQKFVAVNE
jgi:hypothetical protein